MGDLGGDSVTLTAAGGVRSNGMCLPTTLSLLPQAVK